MTTGNTRMRARDASGKFVSQKKARALGIPTAPVTRPTSNKAAPSVEFSKNYRTAQIYSKGFEFAFMAPVKGVYKQACTFVYCKDFLHDAVWAMINKTEWAIFGFKYDTSKDVPLDLNNCVFAFRNTQYKTNAAKFHAQKKNCQEFLNKVEEQLGFQPSVIYEVPHDDSPCWLIVGDKGWQHAPPMVGLYTLLIRLGYAHRLGDSADQTLEKAKSGDIKIGNGVGYAGSRDCGYISSAWKGISAILKHGLNIFHEKIEDNYPLDLPKRGPNLHSAYGPVSFSSGIPKKAMPHWYREELWK